MVYVNLNSGRGGYPPAPDFRTGGSRSTTARPNCTKGFSCKLSCIAKNRSCRNPLEGQHRTYSEWLQAAVNRGDMLSDAHRQEVTARGIRASGARSAAPQQRSRSSLPEGMSRVESRFRVQYNFRVGNNDVEMYFNGDKEESPVERSVGFKINGEYYMQRDRLSVEQREQISRKVFAALRHQMSQETNAEYECSAWRDGSEGFRAMAYQAVGFSRPNIGQAGYAQFAVIKDGRIDPEATKQRLRRFESQYSSDDQIEEYDRRWQRSVNAINGQRDRRRREQRNAA